VDGYMLETISNDSKNRIVGNLNVEVKGGILMHTNRTTGESWQIKSGIKYDIRRFNPVFESGELGLDEEVSRALCFINFHGWSVEEIPPIYDNVYLEGCGVDILLRSLKNPLKLVRAHSMEHYANFAILELKEIIRLWYEGKRSEALNKIYDEYGAIALESGWILEASEGVQ
jgi:hypothetical protein